MCAGATPDTYGAAAHADKLRVVALGASLVFAAAYAGLAAAYFVYSSAPGAVPTRAFAVPNPARAVTATPHNPNVPSLDLHGKLERDGWLPLLAPIAFGSFWAGLIFVLDRGLILTLEKSSEPLKHLADIGAVLPGGMEPSKFVDRSAQGSLAFRFFLAALNAFVVSQAVELWLYQEDIDNQLRTVAEHRVPEPPEPPHPGDLDQFVKNSKGVKDAMAAFEQKKKDFDDCGNEVKDAKEAVECEIKGTCDGMIADGGGVIRKPGCGRVCRDKKLHLADVERQCGGKAYPQVAQQAVTAAEETAKNQYEEALRTYTEKLDGLRQDRWAKIDAAAAQFAHSPLTRSKTLWELALSHWTAGLRFGAFLALLFCVELMPLFLKQRMAPNTFDLAVLASRVHAVNSLKAAVERQRPNGTEGTDGPTTPPVPPGERAFWWRLARYLFGVIVTILASYRVTGGDWQAVASAVSSLIMLMSVLERRNDS